MHMVAIVFTVFVSLVLPIGLAVFLAVQKKGYLKPILLGAVCFFVFQCLIRIPILGLLQTGSAGYNALSMANPVLMVFVTCLSAGVFEEVGRYIVMRFMFKNKPLGLDTAICFGVGHGGIEAILLVGINYIIMLCTSYIMLEQAPIGAIFAAGAERLLAMVLHIALSVLVMLSVNNKKPLLLVLAVILHIAVNFAVSIIALLGATVFWVEICMMVCTVGVCITTLMLGLKYLKGEKVENEKMC